MAGYDFSNGRSNNAVAAEDRGLVLAGTIARFLGRGVTAADVENVLPRAEWHHVGAAFAERNYYEWPEEPLIARIRTAASERKTAELKSFVADVEWFDWPAFRAYDRRRRKPQPTERRLCGAAVTIKGQFATITHPDLTAPLRKKVGSRGFVINKTEAENVSTTA